MDLGRKENGFRKLLGRVFAQRSFHIDNVKFINYFILKFCCELPFEDYHPRTAWTSRLSLASQRYRQQIAAGLKMEKGNLWSFTVRVCTLFFFRRSLTRGGCSTFPFPSELTWAGITGLIYELVNCFDAQLIQYSKRFAALAGWGRAADSLLKQISVLAVNLQPVIGSCFPHHSFGDCGALPQTGC